MFAPPLQVGAPLGDAPELSLRAELGEGGGLPDAKAMLALAAAEGCVDAVERSDGEGPAEGEGVGGALTVGAALNEGAALGVLSALGVAALLCVPSVGEWVTGAVPVIAGVGVAGGEVLALADPEPLADRRGEPVPGAVALVAPLTLPRDEVVGIVLAEGAAVCERGAVPLGERALEALALPEGAPLPVAVPLPLAHDESDWLAWAVLDAPEVTVGASPVAEAHGVAEGVGAGDAEARGDAEELCAGVAVALTLALRVAAPCEALPPPLALLQAVELAGAVAQADDRGDGVGCVVTAALALGEGASVDRAVTEALDVAAVLEEPANALLGVPVAVGGTLSEGNAEALHVEASAGLRDAPGLRDGGGEALAPCASDAVDSPQGEAVGLGSEKDAAEEADAKALPEPHALLVCEAQGEAEALKQPVPLTRAEGEEVGVAHALASCVPLGCALGLAAAPVAVRSGEREPGAAPVCDCTTVLLGALLLDCALGEAGELPEAGAVRAAVGVGAADTVAAAVREAETGALALRVVRAEALPPDAIEALAAAEALATPEAAGVPLPPPLTDAHGEPVREPLALRVAAGEAEFVDGAVAEGTALCDGSGEREAVAQAPLPVALGLEQGLAEAVEDIVGLVGGEREAEGGALGVRDEARLALAKSSVEVGEPVGAAPLGVGRAEALCTPLDAALPLAHPPVTVGPFEAEAQPLDEALARNEPLVEAEGKGVWVRHPVPLPPCAGEALALPLPAGEADCCGAVGVGCALRVPPPSAPPLDAEGDPVDEATLGEALGAALLDASAGVEDTCEEPLAGAGLAVPSSCVAEGSKDGEDCIEGLVCAVALGSFLLGDARPLCVADGEAELEG